MWTNESQWRKAFVAVEVACVMAVIALLLAVGFAIHGSVRLAARVAVAEANLNQVATGMDLYFRKYCAYPPQGCDLAEELAPFIDDPRIFSNPLMNEKKPGETMSLLYRAPTNDEVDKPNYYLTALVSNNGHTSVVLWTGHRVERHEDIAFNPKDPSDFHASLNPSSGDTTDDVAPSDDGEPAVATKAIRGGLNINPNNNDRFEFSMELPNGDVIDRDNLHSGTLDDGSPFESYCGQATQIRVCPKGNGNQNCLLVLGDDGEYHPYPVKNGTLLLLASDAMWARLRNVKSSNGKAMGQWWIDIWTNTATITEGL